MIDTLRRICELQQAYSPDNTPEMQERGRLIRGELADAIRSLHTPLSTALGTYGSDFHVDASDGIGRKTELPWVRFCSLSMSPRPTQGFYCVLHFATDGTAVFVTVGCGSSKFQNGSFVRLPDIELEKRTAWARNVILESTGTLEPFVDQASYGARRPLPKSFEKATAIAKRIGFNELNDADFETSLIEAASRLRLIYIAESDGREMTPSDQDEIEIAKSLRPLTVRSGQGYGLSPDDRRKVELQAMKLSQAWLEQEGYHVEDTSANHPYDFEATTGNLSMKVEVKGTTSDTPEAILMTRNEVELHRSDKGSTALMIVSGIRLASEDGQRIATGGIVEAFIGWDIDEWVLSPTMFRVEKRGNLA